MNQHDYQNLVEHFQNLRDSGFKLKSQAALGCPSCGEPLAENLGFRQEVSPNEFTVDLDESGDLEYSLVEEIELSQDGVYFCRSCDSDLPLDDEEALAVLNTVQAQTA